MVINDISLEFEQRKRHAFKDRVRKIQVKGLAEHSKKSFTVPLTDRRIVPVTFMGTEGS